MNIKEYRINGMSCQHCVMGLKQELEQIEGLKVVSVEIGRAELEFDQAKLDEKTIVAAIAEAGYAVVA